MNCHQTCELVCNKRTIMRHHAALMVLTTKEHGQNLDFPLISAWTKPTHGTIQSQVAKERKEIIVWFSTKRKCD